MLKVSPSVLGWLTIDRVLVNDFMEVNYYDECVISIQPDVMDVSQVLWCALNAMMTEKGLVESFLHFLSSEMSSGRLGADGNESLEVAVQCLETVYGVSAQVSSAFWIKKSLG